MSLVVRRMNDNRSPGHTSPQRESGWFGVINQAAMNRRGLPSTAWVAPILSSLELMGYPPAPAPGASTPQESQQHPSNDTTDSWQSESFRNGAELAQNYGGYRGVFGWPSGQRAVKSDAGKTSAISAARTGS